MSNTMARSALPMPTGGFFIPAIDEAVPMHLRKDRQRSQALARFARAAEGAGVPMPVGGFQDIEQVVREQWNQFLAASYPLGIFDGTAGAPMVSISDETLEIVINSESRLNAFQLKPVVEPLETAAPGLGWFVEAVLFNASCHGHQIYEMGMATYMLDVYHQDLPEFTDRAYARHLLEEHGDDDVPKLEEISQESIDELKAQYSFWPSELIAEVGGHEHLLRRGCSPGTKGPEVMSVQAVKDWLQANRKHPLASGVETAVTLHDALRKDRSRDFVWDGQDGTEPMGALCFICWEEPHLLFEAVSHHEQNQYQGGEAVEAFARRTVQLAQADDLALRDLAAATVAYFNRWALLAKLLSYFPVWEDDDET